MMFSCFKKKRKQIFYLHGFGAYYDTQSNKVKALFELGRVNGINVDYSHGFDECFDEASLAVLRFQPDFLAGSSMGGHMVTHLSAKFDIPFIAFNPAVVPSTTLAGREDITKENLDTYPAASTYGRGVIFLNRSDQVIDTTETYSLYSDVYPIVSFPGGNHSFQNSTEAVAMFESYMRTLK
jgi:predicted esterase YcpF (UPF0227 family)